MQVIQATVAAAQQDALFAIFEQMEAFHPREAHWHLPLIGVEPAHQGQGIGAALLRHVLSACDTQRSWPTWKRQARATCSYTNGTALKRSVVSR